MSRSLWRLFVIIFLWRNIFVCVATRWDAFWKQTLFCIIRIIIKYMWYNSLARLLYYYFLELTLSLPMGLSHSFSFNFQHIKGFDWRKFSNINHLFDIFNFIIYNINIASCSIFGQWHIEYALEWPIRDKKNKLS